MYRSRNKVVVLMVFEASSMYKSKLFNTSFEHNKDIQQYVRSLLTDVNLRATNAALYSAVAYDKNNARLLASMFILMCIKRLDSYNAIKSIKDEVRNTLIYALYDLYEDRLKPVEVLRLVSTQKRNIVCYYDKYINKG